MSCWWPRGQLRDSLCSPDVRKKGAAGARWGCRLSRQAGQNSGTDGREGPARAQLERRTLRAGGSGKGGGKPRDAWPGGAGPSKERKWKGCAQSGMRGYDFPPADGVPGDEEAWAWRSRVKWGGGEEVVRCEEEVPGVTGGPGCKVVK